MNLKELKSRIDEMSNKYGDIAVMVDIIQDDLIDDTIYISENGNISTENIQDVTELKDYNGNNITGICLSNYIMKDNNWGKDDENV